MDGVGVVVVWLYHVRVSYENYRENLRCEICLPKHQECVLEISSNTSYFRSLNGVRNKILSAKLA